MSSVVSFINTIFLYHFIANTNSVHKRHINKKVMEFVKDKPKGIIQYLSKMMNFLTESLNEPIDGDFLITSGREFHKTGPKQLIDSCFIFKIVLSLKFKYLDNLLCLATIGLAMCNTSVYGSIDILNTNLLLFSFMKNEKFHRTPYPILRLLSLRKHHITIQNNTTCIYNAP